MRLVAAPIKRNDVGDAVTNLQDCLLFLLDKAKSLIPDNEHAPLIDGLIREKTAQIYSDITTKAVGLFQGQTQPQFHLKVTGDVDASTADALNTLLRQYRAFDTPQPDQSPVPVPSPNINPVVRGQVLSTAGDPQEGVEINVFDRDIGDIRDRLGDPAQRYLTDDQGHFVVQYSPDQFMRGDKDTPDLVFQLGSVLFYVDASPGGRATGLLQIDHVRRLPLSGDTTITEPVDVSGDDLILGIEARPVEEVQIFLTGTDLPRGASEFDQVLQALQPVLLAKSPGQLDESRFRDITFAAREVSLDRELVECLVLAYQLSETLGAADISPTNFYGLARESQIKTIERIAVATVAELAASLTAASSAEVNHITAFDSVATIASTAGLIHRRAVAHSLQIAPATNLASLTQILSKVLPSVDEQTLVVEEFANHTGKVEQFWEKLADNPTFQAAGKIPAIQFGLQVGTLAEGRIALIDAIHDAGKYKSIRDLALNTEDLPSLVKNVPADQLTEFPGTTQGAKAAYYAIHLEGILQAAFPTETVAKTLERTDLPDAINQRFRGVANILKQASTLESFPLGDHFDIRTTHVETFFNSYKDVLLPGVTSDQFVQTVADVKHAQRVFRVSASPQSFSVLMAHGFSSAHGIAKIPPSSFLAQFGSKLGSPEIAMLIHGKAMSASLAGTQMAVQAWQDFADAKPMAAGGGIKQLPSWAQMFGSAEVCECQECNSVFGAAAYFVDLLQYLGNSTPNDKGLTPLDYLIGKEDDKGDLLLQGRRPDIAYLALTCENTNTTIPYVDLVNEVMESYVVHGNATKEAAHDVGDRTTAELLANPQYVEDSAYDSLTSAVYPPSLPFDRALESIRAYLGQLQTSLLELKRMFASPLDEWTPTIVAEQLGFSAKEYSIVTGKDLDGSDAGITVQELYGFVPPIPPNPPQTVGEQVGPVRIFLARSELSYVELIDIVKARFANPAQRQFRLLDTIGMTADEISTLESSNFATIPASVQQKLTAVNHTAAELQQWFKALDGLAVLFSDDSECDLDNTSLLFRNNKPLDDSTLLNIHRFVRIWRSLGWSVAELDAAMVSRGFATNPVSGLRDLAQIKALSEQTGLTVSQLLVLWSNIDTFGPVSTYRQLFENHAVSREPDPSFVLNVTEDEIDKASRGTPDKLADEISSVAAAIRVRDQDVVSICTDAAVPSDAPLNLANVSLLFRYSVLARSLGIPLRLLIELRNLAGDYNDPFVDPGAALRFVALAEKVNNAGFSALQLAYWCRQDDVGGVLNAGISAAATDLNNRLAILLSQSKDEKAALLGDKPTGQEGEPTVDQMRTKLALAIVNPKNLEIAGDIIEGISKLSPEDQKTFIAAHGTFDLFMDPEIAATALSDAVDTDPVNREKELFARRIAILTPLLAYLERQLVKKTVANTVGLEGYLVDGLLTQNKVLASLSDPSRPILDDFTELAISLSDSRQKAFLRLSMVTLIVNAFRLTIDEVNYFSAHPADFGGFDLNKLPTGPADGKPVFSVLMALMDYVALRDSLGKASIPLIQCLTVQSDAQRLARVSLLTNASVVDVQNALTQLALTPSALAQVTGLQRMLTVLALASTTGVTTVKLKTWSSDATSETSRDIKNTLKAKFDDASWLMIGRSISDALRERQRAALVAYLLSSAGIQSASITTADQLYEYFLIDVQMTPAMQTSRIKQAISSVQLFVDRCFMNLEQDIQPSAIDANQWVWRKNYRVWEANRRVFVNPENWTEIELRDDKSPFFSELESELLQGDLSDSAAQHALIGYLNKLGEVARLETCGHFLEQDPLKPGQSTVHVIARTPAGAPRVYYYRQLLNQTSWTPWEKVDLDIDGKEDGDNTGVQLLPVVWRQRLFLLWLTLTEKSDPPPYSHISATDGATPRDGKPYSDIKLFWSAYDHGKWGKKRVASFAEKYYYEHPL